MFLAVAALDCGGRLSADEDACSPCSPPEDATTPFDASVDSTLPLPEASVIDVSVGDAIVDAGADVGPCGTDHHLSHGVCLADDAAADLPSIDSCLDAGNVLWVHGDPGAYIFAGTSELVGGWWAVAPQYHGDLLEAHYANSSPSDPWWFLFFADSAPFTTGVVYHASSAQSVYPTMDIQYGSAGCYPGSTQYAETGEGAFRIDDLDASDASLKTFNAAFWILCDKASGVLRGCIRYRE